LAQKPVPVLESAQEQESAQDQESGL